MSRRWLSLASVAGLLLVWEAAVRLAGIPAYILPAPSQVLTTLQANLPLMLASWWFTVKITGLALLLACAGGVLLAAGFALSRSFEAVVTPFAVTLQVTPLVAIAPLILIYIDSTTAALLICTFVVAFFPILASTLAGLRAADPNLRQLFRLYRASPMQRLRLLLVPSSVPYFLAGLRIAGGLALIGAVSAEMVAGVAGRETGLASRILEAGFRSETPKMFAALLLLVATGLLIHWVFGPVLQHLLRRYGHAPADH
jgi:NitT/TauT family transport system permease protein